MPLKKPGEPPSNASSELLAAWAIVQGSDRSRDKFNQMKELLDQLPEGHKDIRRIAGLIEAFIASAGNPGEPSP